MNYHSKSTTIEKETTNQRILARVFFVAMIPAGIMCIYAYNTGIDAENVAGGKWVPYLLWGIFLISFGIIAFLISLNMTYEVISEEWHCNNCGKVNTEQQVISNTTVEVQSVTNTTRQITTTHNSQSKGIVGNQIFVMNNPQATVSQVPIVVGEVSAIHKCSFPQCQSTTEWRFSSEVQSWTDTQTGNISYQIQGPVVVPR